MPDAQANQPRRFRKVRGTPRRSYIPLQPPIRAGGLPTLPLPKRKGHASCLLHDTLTGAYSEYQQRQFKLIDSFPPGVRQIINDTQEGYRLFLQLFQAARSRGYIISKLRELNCTSHTTLADL